jgi:hypothetical protein
LATLKVFPENFANVKAHIHWQCLLAKMLAILFCAVGFFNEADTLESSSILIYLQSMAGFYTL